MSQENNESNFLDLPDEEFEKFGMYPPSQTSSASEEEESLRS